MCANAEASNSTLRRSGSAVTDGDKATTIGLAALLALLLTWIVGKIVGGYLTPWATHRLSACMFALGAVGLLGAVLGGDLVDAVCDLYRRVFKRKVTRRFARGDKPATMRIFGLAFAIVVIFSFMIYITGGPLVSPFSSYLLGAITLGLFLAESGRTKGLLVLFGTVLYAILCVAGPPLTELNRVYINGLYPVTDRRPQVVYALLTFITIVISVLVSVKVEDTPSGGTAADSGPGAKSEP